MGLTGTIVSILLFGLSKSYAWALISRSLCGLLNGNVGVLKSMVAELTVDLSSNQRARAFSYLPLVFGLGYIVGPVLGGFLSRPVEQYPSFFGGRGWLTQFLEEYPYFLPCFVAAVISAIGLLFGFMFLEETMEGKRRQPLEDDDDAFSRRPLLSDTATPTSPNGNTEYHTFPASSTSSTTPTSSRAPSPSPTLTIDIPIPTPANPTLRSVLTPSVMTTVLVYMLVCLQTIMYEELYTLWTSTLPDEGGLGFTPHDIGISLSIAGVMTLIMQLLLWPRLQRRFGTLPVFRCALAAYIPLYFVEGFLRNLVSASNPRLIWVGLLTCLAIESLCNVTVYTSSMILVSNSASSLNTLGTINGFSQCMASGMRAIGPATCGVLYSWALGEEALPWIARVHFMWGVLSVVAFVTWRVGLRVRDRREEEEKEEELKKKWLLEEMETEETGLRL
ncbi:major facilitator superfamily domain-containing protein [Endogone sp. FLAS-F59071]|nr:major facilitator superfamily domain-containing protein [Endogone sp. FLAS-F59071]|eukprot:RUS19352.1 major facilitator superfamily domain-containing protein [Endogone sp. FLAS-F59071]